MIKSSYIDNINIFKNLKDATKEELKNCSNIMKLEKNEVLFEEKEKINNIYFVIDGKVSIFKINENGDRKVIFILNEGEMINEITTDKKRESSVFCEVFENATILKYNIDDFIKIMEKDFYLTKNIINYMERRNRRLYRQLKNSISIKMDKKLAAKLYRISKEFGTNKGEWTLIDVNISITYLSDMLGCKRETLSRAMKTLQNEGLVKLENKKIFVKEKGLSEYFKK